MRGLQMSVKKSMITLFMFLAALSLCLIPARKVKAENWMEMYPDDGTDNPECLVEYDLDSGMIRAFVTTNEGYSEWAGLGEEQSVASMFGGAMKFESLTIGKDVTRFDNRALAPLKKGLGELIIEEGNTKFKIQDGMVVNQAGDTIFAVLKSYTDEHPEEITLPDSITTIGSHAFDSNQNIKTVHAPKVTGIDGWAFAGSSISNFTTDNLTYIGENVFQNCESLEAITIETNDGVTLHDGSFWGCKNLKIFPYKTDNLPISAFSKCISLESFTIENNITEVGSYAFDHCTGLTEMTIPSSVTKLGSSAFDTCSNLKTLTFESSVPPTVGEHVLSSCPSDLKIVVPAGSEDAYVEAFGIEYYDNIYETGVEKYGVFINGEQFSSNKKTITCGGGTAVYNPDTKTLTLNNVTVNEATIVKKFGSWLHGGTIYSKLDNLTIVVNGTNTISADADGISTESASNVTIKGTGKLILDTLAISDGQMASMYIGLGDDPTGIDGGDLIIDGPVIEATRELQANRNLIIKGGSKVTSGGRLRSNNNGNIEILDGADVTAKWIDFGLPSEFSPQEVYQRDMSFVLDGGTLTLQGAERTYGDTKRTVNGIFFCPNYGEERDPRGHVEIKEGTLVIEKAVDDGSVLIDCPDENIVIGDGMKVESDGSDLTVEKLQRGAITASSGRTEPKLNGFCEYQGGLFLFSNGNIVTSANGLVQDPNNRDDWYFCANGKVQTQKSTLVQYPARTNNWFYVQKGKLDTTYNGMVTYNGGDFFVARGKILTAKQGLFQDPNNKNDWYFLANGQVQKKKTGIAIYNKAGFYVEKGKLNSNFTGKYTEKGKTYNVVKGRVV